MIPSLLWAVCILSISAGRAQAYFNGAPEPGMPAVASFRTERNICNGTFIIAEKNELEVLLTAGHCLDGLDEKSRIMLTNGGKVGAIATAFWRIAYDDKTAKERAIETDVGIVLFPTGTAAGVIPIAPNPVGVGDLVTSASWHPKGAGKSSGTNRVCTYGLRKSDQSIAGYVLSGADGGVPNIPGESGSALVSKEGVVGVFSGKLTGSSPCSNVPSVEGIFASIHSKFIVSQLQLAKEKFPGPFDALDLSSLVTFDQLDSSVSEPVPLARPVVPPLSSALKALLNLDREPKQATGSNRAPSMIELPDSLD